MNKLLLTTALIGSMATAGLVYAADAPVPAASTPAAAPVHNGHHSRMDDALAKFKPADADMVRNTMKESHQKNQPLYDKLDELHNQRFTLAGADKFDQSAYMANSASIGKVEADLHVAMDKTMAGILAKLPADERKELAAIYGPRGHGHGHHPAPAAAATKK